MIGENDHAWKVLAKVREYFDAGVSVVWLIYPNVETVHVHSSYSKIEVFTREQTLDGGTVVQGFKTPLVDLFEEEVEAPVPTSPESDPAA